MLAVYLPTLVVAAAVLFGIGKLPLLTDTMVAIKRRPRVRGVMRRRILRSQPETRELPRSSRPSGAKSLLPIPAVGIRLGLACRQESELDIHRPGSSSSPSGFLSP